MQHLSTPTESPDTDELTDDALTGRVRVLQRRRGHRYSLDDVLTARTALLARPDARVCLDLGCGIGSVLLMVADTLQEARVLGIEAQEVSLGLVQRNIARNALQSRVQAVHGDIRDADLLAHWVSERQGLAPQGFDLVTGTPPYMPAGTATASPDSQRAHARVELRGGVEVYVQAAGRVLAADGVCVVCAQAGADERVERAAIAAGLVAVERLDAFAAQGRGAALLSVHTLVRAQAAGGRTLRIAAPFFARDAQGQRTSEAGELRSFFGLQAAAEAPSPRVRGRAQTQAWSR